jgi:Ca2+-transporting ATPase
MSVATVKRPWHTAGIAELFQALEASDRGLTSAQARARLSKYGPNKLPEQPPPAWWQIALRQFKSPLIYILAAAAVVSLAIHPDDPVDAIFIAAVLLINALIGGYQEWKAERSTRALQKLLQIRASVLRDGKFVEVDATEVVPGDIVALESGNRVPADIRLLTIQGLEVDESLLTGESLPVRKDPLWVGDEHSPMADRLNMAFAGSLVARGRARGVVVATGASTAVGQLAIDVMSAAGGKAPLLERMERFTHTIGYAILGVALLIALVGVTLRGYGLMEMFMFGVALAVSAIPEGLPVAMTVALAIATTRMARRGVIVRRLAAVEGLGSCTLIASDKTGTLTCNQLTAREVMLPDGTLLSVSGEGFVPEGQILLDGQPIDVAHCSPLKELATAAVLCNEADLHQENGVWAWRGDPTDLALLVVGYKAGLSQSALAARFPQVSHIPFEPERQMAATFNSVEGRIVAFVKGAPERVLRMCRCDRPQKLEQLLHQAESMAEKGFRMLALAKGPAAEDFDPHHPGDQFSDLEFLGFVGMIDPLRPGVREAVAACHDAGVVVSMVTGDHPITALAIARDLGIADSPDQVVTGRELQQMSPEQLTEVVKRVRVFARTSPRQKLELVDAAQRAGHYVAVTGDGINDAPALRHANIGVAMGKAGTDVARESAELVITDDNFATIVAGVEEGRVAYDNVRKVIYLLISTGAAEVLLLGLVVLLGLPQDASGLVVLPLLPAQLLWLNLVTNGIQDVALAFEPSEGGVLKRKPRPPKESVFNQLMIERTVVAAVWMAGVAFAALYWMIAEAGMSAYTARNLILLLFVLFENVHIANSRSETKSAFALSPLRNPILLGGVIVAFAVHIASLYIPFMQRVLSTEPVSMKQFLILLALAMTLLAVMELHKLSWHLRRKARGAAA